ncbi:MAG: DUF1559 domain-containing protein [Planctomycetota bacterium]
MPWLLRSRERSRRMACQSHLQSIALGLQAYHASTGFYPAGTFSNELPVCNRRQGFHHNWLSGLVGPMRLTLDAPDINTSISIYAGENEDVLRLCVPTFRCPSYRGGPENATCYAGNTGPAEKPIDGERDGIFFANRYLTSDDVTDGLEHTLFVAEKLPLPDDLGWLSGTRSSLRNGGHKINATPSPSSIQDACEVGGFGSRHVGGANVLMGSGRWSFMAESTDLELLQQICDRDDG